MSDHSEPKVVTVVESHSIKERCINTSEIEFENPPWLPQNLFPARDRVEAAIREEKCFQNQEQLIPRLVDYSCQNPRIFLTLAVTELLKKLILLCPKIRDSHLPVDFRSNRDGDFTLRSIEDREHRALEGFTKKDKSHKGWKLTEVEQFVLQQWRFLAAVFRNDSFVYAFHKHRPLPYILLDGGVGAGHFGKVVKLGLQEDYVEPRETPYPGVEKVN